MVKDGVAEMTAKLGRISSAATITEMLDVFKEMRDWASLEQTRIGIYTPSDCTQKAVSLYTDAMTATETVASDFLDWVASGMTGDAPDTGGAREAGQTLGSALLSVQASCK